jgi:hypothetical protein
MGDHRTGMPLLTAERLRPAPAARSPDRGSPF